ncbi:MAG: SDR family oxidoreductase [Planctomycetes bacterium]|nr:SDR family oxidoreductase [Planctomycetota bacterium]
MRFKDRTAIVTGAASGMGLMTAQGLAREGAKVVMVDINHDAVKAAAEEIGRQGGTALGVQVDARRYEDVKGAVDLAVTTYGSIDIVVYCAGGSAGRVLGRPQGEEFHNHPIEVIDWGLDVNLRGAVYLAHAVLTPMFKQGRGVIVSLGSVDGVAGSRAVEYGAAKGGIIGLTKSLAVYSAEHGVRACCVSPGPVLTRPAMAKVKTRLGRAAQPEEVTNLILYLCSDDAAFITGTNYVIDGGRSVGMP